MEENHQIIDLLHYENSIWLISADQIINQINLVYI